MRNLNIPCVTQADVQAAIVDARCFTADQGVYGAVAYASLGSMHIEDVAHDAPSSLSLLTICVLTLKNGYTVLGKSACASPKLFNAELGARLAREDAERQVWPLLGYELRTALSRPVLSEADAAADLAGTPRQQPLI